MSGTLSARGSIWKGSLRAKSMVWAGAAALGLMAGVVFAGSSYNSSTYQGYFYDGYSCICQPGYSSTWRDGGSYSWLYVSWKYGGSWYPQSTIGTGSQLNQRTATGYSPTEAVYGEHRMSTTSYSPWISTFTY
jgi:hypothetical protein